MHPRVLRGDFFYKSGVFATIRTFMGRILAILGPFGVQTENYCPRHLPKWFRKVFQPSKPNIRPLFIELWTRGPEFLKTSHICHFIDIAI